MVFGRVCLANGSIALMRTSRISMVFALAATVRAFGRDAADHHLDSQHYSHLLCLAPAHPWTAVGASRLDRAGGVRIRGRRRCSYRFTSDQTISRASMFSGRSGVKPTASVGQADAPHQVGVA